MSLKTDKQEVVGFGFEATRGSYHFVVTIPRNGEGMVTVAEHFVYGEAVEEAAARARFAEEPLSFQIRPPQPKVEIPCLKWQRVAEDVRAEFNRRLRAAGFKAGSWKPGENRLAAYLGKELTLLLWSIEGADPSLVPNAMANWQGLAPEERWWLYTTINAATGHASAHGRGWRKAIGIAFTENPVTERPYMPQSLLPPVAPLAPAASGADGAALARRNGKGRKTKTAAPESPALPFDETTP